ncbi:MAG TPA: hypothetical protein P5533_07105 [Candidatus Cloacimonadota bacterium]|nr:hypothetical protein [Candidatus Cloacimonadota bacterium]
MPSRRVFAGLFIILLIIMGCAKRSTAWQNPDKLELLRQIPIVGNPMDIDVEGNNVYIAQDQGGFSIVNLSDYSQKWYTSIKSSDGSVVDMIKIRKISAVGARNFLFINETDGTDLIRIVDISNPDSLKVVDAITGATQDISDMHFFNLATPQGSYIIETTYTSGRNVYYGRYNGTLWLGQDYTIVPPASASGAAMDTNCLYVADQQHGLVIYNRANQQKLGQIVLPGEAQKVKVSGNYAYVASRQGGLHVVDISDPVHPVKTYSYDTTGYASAVDVAEGYLAVSSGSGGVYLFSLSSPAQPKFLQQLTECGYTNTVRIHNGKLIVGARDMGVMIYDIED